MAAAMLCALCACGAGETTAFKMKKEKGNDGYTCYGFKSERDTAGQVEIPAEYRGKAVQYVGLNAFQSSDVVTVDIPEGVVGIGVNAFLGCSKLESIRLPQSLTSIGTSAFSGCTALEAVSLPQGLTELASAAFGECTALKEICIPSGVTKLEEYVFNGCSSLETVVIEGPIDTLGIMAFKNCASLKVIYLPETLTTIDAYALYGCDALEEIHFAGTAEEFLSIDFSTFDWMTAKNVLVCCADNDILMEDRNSWDYSDQWVRYPRDPSEALTGSDDRSDPAPDETMPEGSGSEPAEFVNTSQTTQTIAPYHAIAMEHDGYIYYFDDDADLCRADGDMTGMELFCEKPQGSYWSNDIDSVNMIGISDTDVMYITGTGHSYAVDLASGQMQELVTGTPGEKVRLYGMCGEWIYYTRSNASKNTLYRSGLSDGFAGEELVISGVPGDLEEIYVTDTYLIYVVDEGINWSLYCAPLMDIGVPIWRDSGSGDYSGIHLIGADGAVAVYYKKGNYVTYAKYYACDLASGNTVGGSKLPPSHYAYDGDGQRVYYFGEYLSYVKLEDFADPVAYSSQNRYESAKSRGGWRITRAGDWLFFRQNQSGGGADYCIDSSGVTFMDLQGLT